ncbi:AbrB family transcriptional regulator [Ideonella sp. B508-1]|uniref:AbrB family transcriptional regulator n=1 Tax=Ideonella sp. B508-1 TaxID=137716 RepID=UPI0003450654|nr:AbrB family transcriptional regulator [Ideonella sp. B508-1]
MSAPLPDALPAAPAPLPAARRWACLVLLTLVLTLPMAWLRVPAPSLLGAIVAGVSLGLAGQRVRVPMSAFMLSQALLGLMIARACPLPVFAELMRHWEVFLLGVTSVIVLSVGLGWQLARWKLLPGSTAIWGSFPGAASAMTLLAGEFGADVRLVALMQYLRVVMVATLMMAVSGLVGGAGNPPAGLLADWLAPVDVPGLGLTLSGTAFAAAAAWRWRPPGGALVLGLVGGVLIQDVAGQAVVLPPWLLAAAALCLGWNIGLRFDRAVVSHALRVLPRLFAVLTLLLLLCGGMAGLLVRWMGVDPLTAYLAMSPGGADSVALIAASSQVDAPFVMAMQTGRLLAVLAVGPAVARWVSRRSSARAASGQ